MRITPYGVQFNDVFELNYNIMSSIGIEVYPDGSLYDPDRDTIIACDGKTLKTTINPMDIKYAGQGECMFDPLNNVKQVTTLMGYFIDKKVEFEEMTFQSWYPEEMEDSIMGWKYSSITIKTEEGEHISTHYYYNKCLKFIEMIFILGEQDVNLLNFDLVEDRPVKNKRRKLPPNPTRPLKQQAVTFEEM